jgi:hypothetical protein
MPPACRHRPAVASSPHKRPLDGSCRPGLMQPACSALDSAIGVAQLPSLLHVYLMPDVAPPPSGASHTHASSDGCCCAPQPFWAAAASDVRQPSSSGGTGPPRPRRPRLSSRTPLTGAEDRSSERLCCLSPDHRRMRQFLHPCELPLIQTPAPHGRCSPPHPTVPHCAQADERPRALSRPQEDPLHPACPLHFWLVELLRCQSEPLSPTGRSELPASAPNRPRLTWASDDLELTPRALAFCSTRMFVGGGSSRNARSSTSEA